MKQLSFSGITSNHENEHKSVLYLKKNLNNPDIFYGTLTSRKGIKHIRYLITCLDSLNNKTKAKNKTNKKTHKQTKGKLITYQARIDRLDFPYLTSPSPDYVC